MRELRDDGLGQSDERLGWFRRKVKRIGEAGRRGQPERKGGDRRENCLEPVQYGYGDFTGLREGVQQRNVRWDTEARRWIESFAQAGHVPLGLGDLHYKRGLGHQRDG